MLAACTAPGPPTRAQFPFEDLHGQVFSPPQVLADAARGSSGEAPNAIVLAIDSRSSFRAVAGAVQRLRERNVAVGYWVDVLGGADAGQDFESILARARAALNDRPPADAVFLAGFDGPALSCGCARSTCGVADLVRDPRDAGRLLSALRAHVGGATIVPVVSAGGSALEGRCDLEECSKAQCAERERLAWSELRREAPRVALMFRPDERERARLAASISARILHQSQLGATPPPAGPGTALVLAVFDASEWTAADLRQALAGVRQASRGGSLVSHSPPAADRGSDER